MVLRCASDAFTDRAVRRRSSLIQKRGDQDKQSHQHQRASKMRCDLPKTTRGPYSVDELAETGAGLEPLELTGLLIAVADCNSPGDNSEHSG